MTPCSAATGRIAITIGPSSGKATIRIAAALSPPIAAASPPLHRIAGPDAAGQVTVFGAGAVAGREGWAWSWGPLDNDAGDHLANARRQDDAATLRIASDGRIELRGGISGAQGQFIHLDRTRGVATIASAPAALVEAGSATAAPDWDAWAQLIVSGGPLGSATPFRDVRRLQTDQALVAGDGLPPRIVSRPWEWYDAVTGNDGRVDTIADAVDAAVERLARRRPLQVLLSGGWDSRVLATLALRHDPAASAWTTSKDSGTAWEELVARQVAGILGLPHHLVQADARGFARDLDAYAVAVDHQTPYHVWLLALTQALSSTSATTLDGLGGGVFFGGAFPPTRGPGDAHEYRAAQLTRYLRAAPGVLRPEVEAQLEDRTRAGFEQLARPLKGHPEVDALTAYLTRTLPGISLGPYGLVSGATTVATPFLDPDVVAASLRIAPERRRHRALYPSLLERWSPALAQLPTIAEPAPQRRRRPRRSTARATATAFRDRLPQHPVGELLSAELRTADITTWQRHLASHADQHLLRSLWLLAGWLDRHHPSADGLDAFLAPTG